MNPYWFIYHLQFDAITGKLERHYTGSTIKHLTGASLSHYVVKVPSIKEQNKVKRIKNLMELIGELRNSSTQITKSLDVLNQSTLAKAFRGELVEQAPMMNLLPCCSIEFGQSEKKCRVAKAQKDGRAAALRTLPSRDARSHRTPLDSWPKDETQGA
ncbi:hypothetical protein [Leptolyngbya sp. FACHB-711]|uniref:hypothetical protein n=1 Tax=unclassified Leptolyngbya TaxID=2650499 RepID=UPI0016840C19|nr:hypothetical protein [Leptolyngbya sp. FACHB-711]MBD1848445.1 hypothetical protein [Cyanobacteria bacterium FACHB-502]MBD2024159.1 hypothetical protein [Leptolyngbya sp. FACHB-711]